MDSLYQASENDQCLPLVHFGNIKLKAKKKTDILLINKVVFEDGDSVEAKRWSGYFHWRVVHAEPAEKLLFAFNRIIFSFTPFTVNADLSLKYES